MFYRIPLLALVDADAYGLDILSVYKNGSRATQHEGDAVLAPRLNWLGIRASDLLNLDIDQDALIPLTKHDHKKALEMLRRDASIMPEEWRKEICSMLHTRRKAEIEILSSVKTTSSLNPLQRYIVDKLHYWMNLSKNHDFTKPM